MLTDILTSRPTFDFDQHEEDESIRGQYGLLQLSEAVLNCY